MRAPLLFFFVFLNSLTSAQHYLPADGLPEMAREIYESIDKFHPFPSSLAGQQALKEAHAQVQAEIETQWTDHDSIAFPDFRALMAPMQRVTGCGHLILQPHFDSLTIKKIRANHFPLQTVRLEDGAYVLLSGVKTATDSLRPGTRLTAIDNLPVAALFAGMAPFSGLNDRGNEAAAVAKIASFPSYFYQSHYGYKTQMNLTVQRDGGQTETHTLLPVQRPWVDPKKNKTDINKTLAFRFSEDGSTGILRIGKFSSYKFYNGSYYKFIRGVFDSLAQRQTDRLIIDIRDNGGGSNGRINYLYSFLADGPFRFASDVRMTGPARAKEGENAKTRRRRERGAVTRKERRYQRALTKPIKARKAKQRYKGDVAVLINHNSFSASGIFARYVQGNGRGKIVGSVAGASAGVTYGASPKREPLYLGPNEEFELLINTMALYPDVPAPGNVTPDLIVPVTRVGLRAGTDEVLEAALRLLAE